MTLKDCNTYVLFTMKNSMPLETKKTFTIKTSVDFLKPFHFKNYIETLKLNKQTKMFRNTEGNAEVSHFSRSDINCLE